MNQGPKTILETMKFLEKKNTGETLQDVCVGKDFLDKIREAQAIKVKTNK